MSSLLKVAVVLALIWFSLRLYWLLRRLLIRRRELRAPSTRCPACGSPHLDDFSDDDSGMCLACDHVWGVDDLT